MNRKKYESKKQEKVYEKVNSSNPCKDMESNQAPIKIFIYKSKNKQKVLPWQHLSPGVTEKLIRSNLCRGMESKESIKTFISPRNRKKTVAIASSYY